MRVVTLPDGAQSVTVLPAAGGSPVFLGTADVESGGGAIPFVGGDQTGAGFDVGDGSSVDIQTLDIDTTGDNVAAALIVCTGSINVGASEGFGSGRLEVLLDGVSVSPRIGSQFNVADGTTLPYTMSGVLTLSEGAHTIVVRCSTDGGTTATVNPSFDEAGGMNSSVVLWYLSA